MVFVHGLGLSADLWSPHLRRLATAGYHALAPDLPGFGGSAGPLLGQSVPATARWLARLAEAEGLGHAAWVGHSLGAQILVRLAVDAPGCTHALVLAAPTGRTGWHGMRQLTGLLTTALREPPRLVGSVVRRYALRPLTAFGAWLRSSRHDTALDAPLVTCPTLLVTGERDPVVPARFVDRLLHLLPDARLEEIEGAAHAVALDPVGPFTDAVLRFLSRRYC
ncbi:MAG: alpha/beta fold hydrolase [Gemmatimonadota bacterium]